MTEAAKSANENKSSERKLLCDVHQVCVNNFSETNNSANADVVTLFVKGSYLYYHYLCDGFDDKGWGCGYRTLQTICSWVKLNVNNNINVPTIPEIQEILVDIKDKPVTFLNSRQWIGSFEVFLILDKLYDIPCKIVHVNKGDELKQFVGTVQTHFEKFGSPIMMGGDIDCSSKGIMGIRIAADNVDLLVLDPHYVGKEISKEFLKSKGWVKCQPLDEFSRGSFYNLCLPQVKSNLIK